MPPRDAALPRLERWFQGRVVGRPSTGPAPSKLILPSARLSPAGRMAIYAGMYETRLHECLREDFPAVERLAGHAGFHRITAAYLKRHPSRHYSLNRLGMKLPDFLRGEGQARLADVARLEAAMAEVFDAEDVEPLSPTDFAKIPPDRLARASLPFIPAFRLLAFDHPANALVTAARQRRPLPRARRKRSWVAVYRHDYKVQRLDLHEAAHAALEALAAGRRVEAAVRAAARRWTAPPARLQALMRRWFGGWTSEGFFAGIRFS